MAKQQRMTAKEFRSLIGDKPTQNKYHNTRVGSHASKKEHKRSEELQMLQRIGAITELQEQVPFLLVPAQRDSEGHLLERGVTYKADFVYKNHKGELVVEDTKGMRTPEYIIKRKLMLHIHGIKIKEI